MAAGRHGGYRDNEFRDREADFLISRKEIGYSTRIRKGDLEYERGQGQGRDSLDYRSRVRQKDVREREAMNGGHRSTSSRSHSGSSGGAPRRCGFVVRPMDREPGELSSDGSDGAMDSESQVNQEAEVKMLENGVKSRNALESSNLHHASFDRDLPELPNSNSIPDADIPTAQDDDSEVHISEASPSKIDLLPGLSEVPVEISSLLRQEEQPWGDNQGTRVIDDDDDYLPARTIISSRWANDANSPADEGEISDYEDKPKLKRKSGSESADLRGLRKSISPELGEVKREGSEGTRAGPLDPMNELGLPVEIVTMTMLIRMSTWR
ncbi:Cyclin-dependent kinase G-2 [Sesamum angolense]|uniref:Cyclin-dependent kinase G-2 n=1 Tax=Sesamum angolense TaxID=2727404 RepID=A0AAE1X0G7_9LAMI|nr:Cyclin-dependent kinase G-2 [Sesamum angolense]